MPCRPACVARQCLVLAWCRAVPGARYPVLSLPVGRFPAPVPGGSGLWLVPLPVPMPGAAPGSPAGAPFPVPIACSWCRFPVPVLSAGVSTLSLVLVPGPRCLLPSAGP